MEKTGQMLLRQGYSNDNNQWNTLLEYTISNKDLITEHNIAYSCTSSEQESTPIYEEIVEGLDTPDKQRDTKMVDNAAYSTTLNAQVTCTDNVAYKCSSQLSTVGKHSTMS